MFHFTHPFVSQKADGTDPTVVRPSAWNADHAATGDGPGVVGRTAAGAGPLDLLPLASSFLPSGIGLPWFGNASQVPSGWLLCDGSAVSRTLYPNLYTAIGITYGAGDGSTNFNLPDLRGRVVAGADGGAGRLTSATVSPDGNTAGAVGGGETEAAGVNVSGSLSVSVNVTVGGSLGGAASANATAGAGSGAGPMCGANAPVTVSGNLSGSGGGTASGGLSGGTNAVTNVQPTLVANWIIKT
jgi:microcystin-dependent protein